MSEIQAEGIKGQLSIVQLDVTDEESIEKAAAHIQKTFGRLDALVNNAAVGNSDLNPRIRFQECMNTNVLGPFLVSAAFRPLLLKSAAPYSIYVSSGAGSMTRASTPSGVFEPANGEAYRASKAALNMIMVQDCRFSKGTPLKIFGMSPGFVVSNLRGTSEEMRNGHGQAGDPRVAGETMLAILQGERDSDVGRVVTKGGIHPW